MNLHLNIRVWIQHPHSHACEQVRTQRLGQGGNALARGAKQENSNENSSKSKGSIGAATASWLSLSFKLCAAWPTDSRRCAIASIVGVAMCDCDASCVAKSANCDGMPTAGIGSAVATGLGRALGSPAGTSTRVACVGMPASQSAPSVRFPPSIETAVRPHANCVSVPKRPRHSIMACYAFAPGHTLQQYHVSQECTAAAEA